MIGRWTVVNAILAVVILALGIQIARTWMRTVPLGRVGEGAGAAADRDAGRRPKRARAEDPAAVVAAIAEKNLFDQSRSSGGASETAAEATPETPPTPPGVVVVGVRLIGEDAEAVVEDTEKSKEQRRIRAGDSVGDYIVEEIRETSVVLNAANGDSVTLWLDLGAGSATAPTSPRQQPQQRPAARSSPPAARTPAERAERAANRRAAQRAARRRARQQRGRQGASDLPEGVRERLEALRRNR